MTLIMISMIMSILFMLLKHPLSMGAILLMQTLMISMISGLMSMNFWYSYILFLIMIGGMLVLFIYMTSIASNEMFKFSNKIFWMTLISMIFSIMILFYNPMINPFLFKSTLTIHMSLNKFFNYPSFMIMFMMIIYLFITLIAIVKITNMKMGPLRQKF